MLSPFNIHLNSIHFRDRDKLSLLLFTSFDILGLSKIIRTKEGAINEYIKIRKSNDWIGNDRYGSDRNYPPNLRDFGNPPILKH